jgi:hypothetical protein
MSGPIKTFKLLRRQVAGDRANRRGRGETAVYEETYVPDPEGNIILLNPDDANRVFLSKQLQKSDP